MHTSLRISQHLAEAAPLSRSLGMAHAIIIMILYIIIYTEKERTPDFALRSPRGIQGHIYHSMHAANAELLQAKAHPFHFLNSSPLRQIVNFHKITEPP